MNMYSYERLSTKEYLIKFNEDEAVYMIGPEQYAQKIVAALNEYDQPKYCAYCGQPVKREDVVTGAYDGTFCCDEHRRAYDKE